MNNHPECGHGKRLELDKMLRTVCKDHRPKHAGWAPGDYWCNCPVCGREYLGDKRSVSCADCAYASPPAERVLDPTSTQYRRAAKRMFGEDGVIEFDDEAEVSKGDPEAGGDLGAYVQAWVWVPIEEADS